MQECICMLIYSHCLIGVWCHTEEYTFRLYDFNSVVIICIRRKSYRAKERPEPALCDLFTSICLLATHIRKKPFLNSLNHVIFSHSPIRFGWNHFCLSVVSCYLFVKRKWVTWKACLTCLVQLDTCLLIEQSPKNSTPCFSDIQTCLKSWAF